MNLYSDTWSVWHLKTWFIMVHISIYKHQGSYPTPNTQRWKEGRQRKAAENWTTHRYEQVKVWMRPMICDTYAITCLCHISASKIELRECHARYCHAWYVKFSGISKVRWITSKRRSRASMQPTAPHLVAPQQLRTAHWKKEAQIK